MKIGIDIDDTLTNTKDLQIEKWKEYITKNPNPNYTSNIPDNINSFDDEYISNFWDTYREYLSFNPTFKENANIITKKLQEEGYELCIITSRPDHKYKNLKDRLKKWFQENDIHINTIYTDIRNKGQFCKDNNISILVDDSLNHIKEANELNVIGILFNNKNNYDGLQTNNWNELYEMIKKIS